MSDTTTIISIPKPTPTPDCTRCPGFNPTPALWHLIGKKKINSTKEEETSVVICKEWYFCGMCYDHFTSTEEHKDYKYVSERMNSPIPKNITERGRGCLKADQLELKYEYPRCDCGKQLAHCTGCSVVHLTSESTGGSSCLQLLKCCEMTKHEYGFLCVKCVKDHRKGCYREKRKLPDTVDCTICGKNVNTSYGGSRCINEEKDSWLCLDCIGKVKKMRLSPDYIY